MRRFILFLLLVMLAAVNAPAQIDEQIDKLKEHGIRIKDRLSDLFERGSDYVTDKAEDIIERYHLDTIDVERRAQIVDSIMAVRYRQKGKFDEDYIERPSQRFTLKMRANISGSSITTRGDWNGTPLRTHLSSKQKFSTSVGFNYRGLGLSLAVNPLGLKGNRKNTEWNFNMYSNRYGFDFVYQNARDFRGWVETDGDRQNITDARMQSKVLIANGYYAFNNRRFSYPAAFTQSYRQLQSQGSGLLGASLLAGNSRIHSLNGIDNPSLRVSMFKLGIGGGYGYNWVITPQWMVHLSVMPTLVIASGCHRTVDGQRERIPYAFPEFILTSRVAAVYELTESHFFALNFVAFDTVVGSRRDMSLYYDKWRLRLTYGFRF